MQKLCRSVLRWIALKAGIDTKLTRDEWMAAHRLGLTMCSPKPDWMAQQDYRAMLNALAEVAHDYLVAGKHGHAEVASYEPPERNTGPTRSLSSDSLARAIGPTSTQSLPAIDPATGYYKDHRLHMKAYRNFHGHEDSA
jgi:hypothetical protein